MRKICFALLLFLIANTHLLGQKLEIPKDTAVTTEHSVTIDGTRVNYSATAGMQPVWNDDGEVIASLFYTYYKRKDTDPKNRPLVISFNGGPGSASVWMHIAYTGPKILRIDEEGYPLQPYGVKENPFSILDVADIVFVNPVNTAFSRIIEKDDEGKRDRSQFFGVNADIEYLGKWLNTFVTRNDRWLSPKYLIGESYGTSRVSGLALELQNSQWMYLNGVILVSPTEIGIERDGPVEIANRLPYFAATAWYHNLLPSELQQRDLEEFLPEVEQFTIQEVLPALAKGGFLPVREKQALAEKMSYYSAISEEVLLQHNLEVPFRYFWKELLREEGFNVGRLDSRYLGIDHKVAGDAPDYSAELTSWLHSFTPAINHYLRKDLDFETDLTYYMFGPVHPWDRSRNNTGEDLRQAMAQNPNLHVMIQSGYFDGGTTYFNAKYSMWQLDPSGKLKDRLSFKGYRSGHMMYLRREDLKNANDDIREFIEKSLENTGEAARYYREENSK